MVKTKASKLVWDEWNIEHIKKHKVTIKEVKEACLSSECEIQSYLNRKLIIGKTKHGRLLTIVVSFAKQENPYAVSARDASKKERKIYETAKANKTI